jgi:ornithine cyclodeaminase/alanine dehydrogenase-like protein (mu-crystallin family)
MPDLIEAMGRALGDYSAGRAVQPVRSVLEIGPDKNYFGIMPAAVGSAIGAKLVTVYHQNHVRGLPSHLATIVLMDPASGELIAILDGRYITEARTAAVSAVSVKHLASRGASVLALIGSGVQARSHLEAIRHVANLTDVRVWSPNVFHRDQFAKDASADTSLKVRATTDARSAVRGADIIVLATASREPVIANDDVAPGAHIVGVGACRPDQREMPTPLIARARVYVDSRQGALKEAGDLLIPIREGAVNDRHIVGELGELVSGKVAGRIAASGVTIFKSLGMAVEDVVAAQLALERAKVSGLGQSIEFR